MHATRYNSNLYNGMQIIFIYFIFWHNLQYTNITWIQVCKEMSILLGNYKLVTEVWTKTPPIFEKFDTFKSNRKLYTL
jgi:hypothetical protein